MKTYICDTCGKEFVESSFAYINDPQHGTICKLCEFGKRRFNASVFNKLVSVLKIN